MNRTAEEWLPRRMDSPGARFNLDFLQPSDAHASAQRMEVLQCNKRFSTGSMPPRSTCGAARCPAPVRA
ncbi:hypothetical protein BDI4_560129 [Burkholderia diffusa]|nr:hypothetical protein BDI4_560129 [Burkholderia diffusa]